MPYKAEELAYIAGLVDGEGYIGLVKVTETRRIFRTTYCYLPTIRISMCDREGIDFIDRLFKGNIWFHQKQKGWRDQWEWSAKGKKRVAEILKAILPYLKIKKRQAEVLIEFVNERESISTHCVKWGSSSYTEKDLTQNF